MKIIMFPGQGSQSKGMGRVLFDAFPHERAVAEAILGYDLKELCLEDPDNRLAQTEYTQPAIFFVSAIAHIAEGQDGDAFVGHSLGLFAALFASGAFDLATGLRIVKRRGELMASMKHGGMLAVLGLEAGLIEDLLAEGEFTDLDVANYNTPLQVVVSGSLQSIHAFHQFLEWKKIKAVKLPVSGPFHSRLMNPTSELFFEFIAGQDIHKLRGCVISTTNGAPISDAFVLEEMCLSLTSPVLWYQTVSAIKALHPDCIFLERGHGRVLTDLTLQSLNMTLSPGHKI